MLDFKYRVKLVPGPQKKGKAAKGAVEMFLRHPGLTAQQKDNIRGMNDNDIMMVMPSGGVKMSAPGLQAARGPKKGKKNKKK
jgi:hypothetical protein